jgi:SAM-dependent methyltransferase
MKAESLWERIGMALGLVPTPLGDVLLGPLLAHAVIAGSAVGVFDAMAHSPQSAATVADRCGTDPVATAQLLRALHGSGYLDSLGGLYTLTGMSARWLPSDAPRSVHPAILHRKLDLRFMDFEHYLRSGQTANFHAELNEMDWACYQQGQASQARLITKEVVDRVPLTYQPLHMLDLGGGHGAYSVAFCERYPNLRARVLDLAPASADCRALPNGNCSGAARVHFESVDIRQAPLELESVDIILMANVVHHFDEATNLELFRRAGAALKPGGTLIALDVMRTSGARCGQIESLLELYFGCASGGRLWTVDEIRAWHLQAGLRVLPAKSLRLLPQCQLQAARKPLRHAPKYRI